MEKDCKLVFGTYCKVNDEMVPSNTMTPITHEAINLGLTGNLNVTYKLFCLNTGSILKRRKWNYYTMQYQVINTVNKWGGKYN